MKSKFTKHAVNFQCVTPNNHRRNAAGGAMRTRKNHFIASLSVCDLSFPFSECDHLLPQGDIRINHLWSSRRQAKLSYHACLFGKFKFNQTPISVQGTKILIHKTPQQRRSFAPHSLDGFYVVPALQHYLCYT